MELLLSTEEVLIILGGLQCRKEKAAKAHLTANEKWKSYYLSVIKETEMVIDVINKHLP
jgi:hypothetical protein